MKRIHEVYEQMHAFKNPKHMLSAFVPLLYYNPINAGGGEHSGSNIERVLPYFHRLRLVACSSFEF